MNPLIFMHDRPWNQLQSEGYVYTVRGSARKPGEKVWFRRTRTGEKKGEGRVKMCKEFDPDQMKFWLGKYADGSGFPDVYEWVDTIKDNFSGDLPDKLYVLWVNRIE